MKYQKKIKILITEGFMMSNIGSASLIENAVKIVNQQYPAAEITILCQHPESVSAFFGGRIKVFFEFFVFPSIKSKLGKLNWLICNFLWIIADMLFQKFVPRKLYTFSLQKKQTLLAIKNADLIYCIGAERLNENFYKTAYLSVYMLYIMQSYKKPLIHLSMTLGPLKSKYLINIVKKVLNNSKMIFVRDQKSYDLAIKIGIKKSLLSNTYDIALLQDTITLDKTVSLFNKYNISKELPVIGVSVLKWNYINAKGQSRYSDYIDAFAKTCDYLITIMNAEIVFIPTNLPAFGNSANDNETAYTIINQMHYKNNCIVVPDLLNPAELKGIYSLMDFCIVTRMHAAILCTGTGTPVIAVNYQYKLREFMKHLNLEDYSIDIDYLTSTQLLKLTEAIWRNKSVLRQTLLQRIKEMQIELKQNLAIV